MSSSFINQNTTAKSSALLSNQVQEMSDLYAKASLSHGMLTSILGLGQTTTGSSFTPKEVITILLSQMESTDCLKCLHSRIGMGRIFGLTDGEIKAIRDNEVSEPKLSILVTMAHELNKTNFKPSRNKLKRFYAQGYTKNQLCDMIGLIALNNCDHGTDCIPDCRDIINAA